MQLYRTMSSGYCFSVAPSISIYLYLYLYLFFFFYGKDMESQFFADKTIYGQGSPACIITKYCQLHNVFTINLFPSESFPERDFVLAC